MKLILREFGIISLMFLPFVVLFNFTDFMNNDFSWQASLFGIVISYIVLIPIIGVFHWFKILRDKKS
jgi:hypothetical protein